MALYRKSLKLIANVNIRNKRFICSGIDSGKKITDSTWDIIISGGGMVGCAMASSLGNSPILSGKKILLLESSSETEYSIDPVKYSNRVCALNNGTKELFEGFKAWDIICSTRMKVMKKMVVWESCSDARISFQNDLMQDMAFIVENDVILKSLYSVLGSMSDRVHILKGVKAADYELPKQNDEFVTVSLQSGETLKSKLLIGADGVSSLVRKKMGVKYISWNYDQKGIVATLKLSEPTDNVVAWQRFLPTGPIALLPLSEELCSLVWTVSLPLSERLMGSSEEEFVDSLNTALWNEKGKQSVVDSTIASFRNLVSSITPDYQPVHQLPPSILSVESNSRAAFPLGLGHSTEYVAPRVALIGDSAHRIHPLAGQGVNLGFGDVKCLTECLEETVYNGNSIGNMNSLLDYETKRQRHVLPIMFATDALNRLYQTEFTPIVLMRSLGVAALDACNPMKARMMNQASS